jgi:hypothetical protein
LLDMASRIDRLRPLSIVDLMRIARPRIAT